MNISLVKSGMVKVVTGRRREVEFEKRQEAGRGGDARREIFDLAGELADQGVHLEHAEHKIDQRVIANEDRLLPELLEGAAALYETLDTYSEVMKVAKMFLTPEGGIDTEKLTEAMNTLNAEDEKRLLFRIIELGVNRIQQQKRIIEREKSAAGRKNSYSSDDVLMGLIDSARLIEDDVNRLCQKIDVEQLVKKSD